MLLPNLCFRYKYPDASSKFVFLAINILMLLPNLCFRYKYPDASSKFVFLAINIMMLLPNFLIMAGNLFSFSFILL